MWSAAQLQPGLLVTLPVPLVATAPHCVGVPTEPGHTPAHLAHPDSLRPAAKCAVQTEHVHSGKQQFQTASTS